MQISFNSYMFRHRSAIYMQSTKTNHHLTSTPIPVLIAFIVVIKILEFHNLQNLQTNPKSCHTNTTCFELLQVQSGSCLYSVCSRYTNICLAACDPKVSGPVELSVPDHRYSLSSISPLNTVCH